jgi:predicted metalloprotease with PDZ domain
MRARWFLLVCLFLAARPVAAAAVTIQLEVDGTEAPRNILHGALRIPVTPGDITLVYPKWLPGNHRPSGPIQNLTGLRMEAGGRRIDWHRDLVDVYAFHVRVPPGVTELSVALDAITDEGVAGSSGAAASNNVMDVNWNWLILYPAQMDADAVQVAARLRLPNGWKFGTALEPAHQTANEIAFNTVSLTTLIDSPVIAGAHFSRVALDRDHDAVPHAIDIAGESDEVIALTPKQKDHLDNLVAETGVLFGARHYRHYDLLLTLSSQVGGRGLEHHESSDNAPGERFLVDENAYFLNGSLLSHEFTHSWNGKYRRPSGLATKNYQQPMTGELLWVYEGLTEYLGDVLAARSGFWSAEQYREVLADTAARMETRRGRSWRPLEDTGISVQSLRLQGAAWSNWRRGLDYYPEGELLWLEVDGKIRQLTSGRVSIDDFCRLFFGGSSGPPAVLPYTFDDLVSALNKVAAFEWATFLRERVAKISEHAPLAGIEGHGWKLVYTDRPNAYGAAGDTETRIQDYNLSLGLRLDRNNRIVDVVLDSPASRAGLAPHMTLAAVNGRKLSGDVLKAAMADAARTRRPMSLLIESADFYRTYEVEYFDGLRYPHLERVQGTPDRLGQMIEPRRR